jgi:hypothetical protein
MKKYIFGGIAILIVVMVVSFNINVKSRYENNTTLILSNIEALASETASGNSITCLSPYTKVCVSYHGYTVMGIKHSI